MLPLFCCTIGDTGCTAPKEVEVFNANPFPQYGIALVLINEKPQVPWQSWGRSVIRNKGNRITATLASIFAFLHFTF